MIGALNDPDVLISYAGCGCAGGLETTILGELVPKDDATEWEVRYAEGPVSGLRFRDIGWDDGAAGAAGEEAGFFVVALGLAAEGGVAAMPGGVSLSCR